MLFCLNSPPGSRPQGKCHGSHRNLSFFFSCSADCDSLFYDRRGRWCPRAARCAGRLIYVQSVSSRQYSKVEQSNCSDDAIGHRSEWHSRDVSAREGNGICQQHVYQCQQSGWFVFLLPNKKQPGRDDPASEQAAAFTTSESESKRSGRCAWFSDVDGPWCSRCGTWGSQSSPAWHESRIHKHFSEYEPNGPRSASTLHATEFGISKLADADNDTLTAVPDHVPYGNTNADISDGIACCDAGNVA